MALRDDPELMKQYKREWTARRRAAWFADKYCVSCGSIERLELDHINPALKASHNIWSWSEKRRDEEAAKCQVLCHDCHQEKTIAFIKRDITHGTHSKGYLRGCRCVDCTNAHRIYNNNYRLKKKNQTGVG